MDRWEAECRQIEALPQRERASVLRLKIITKALVGMVTTIAGAGGIATALVRWLG